jgi:hypothetical protein
MQQNNISITLLKELKQSLINLEYNPSIYLSDDCRLNMFLRLGSGFNIDKGYAQRLLDELGEEDED